MDARRGPRSGPCVAPGLQPWIDPDTDSLRMVTQASPTLDQLERVVPDRPQLAPGVRLAGQMQESAFVDPPWLVERQGEGYIQLPRPLYRIAELADGQHTLDEIAGELSTTEGRGLTADNIRYLIARQ